MVATEPHLLDLEYLLPMQEVEEEDVLFLTLFKVAEVRVGAVTEAHQPLAIMALPTQAAVAAAVGKLRALQGMEAPVAPAS